MENADGVPIATLIRAGSKSRPVMPKFKQIVGIITASKVACKVKGELTTTREYSLTGLDTIGTNAITGENTDAKVSTVNRALLRCLMES